MANVYEEGNPNAKICLIGEAPSYVEMKLGKPFVGPAGGVLDSCLHEAGIVRAECYLLNVFDEPVRKDRLSNEIFSLRGDLLWKPYKGLTEAGEYGSTNFRKRLRNCKSNVLVPLGATAMDAVCPSLRSIKKWRGSIVADATGRKCISTYHPASVLRGQYLNKYLIISDLKKVKEQKNSPKINLKKREIIIDPLYTDVIAYLKDCARAKEVALDIEIHNRHVNCISFAPSPTLSMSIPFIDRERQTRWTPEQEEEIWLLIAKIIANPKIRKINQNILFDFAVLFDKNNIHWDGPIGDCMIAHNIMYPDFLKGLDMLCSLYTDIPYYKDDGKTWRDIKDWPKYWNYNGTDAVAAFESWNQLIQEPQWPDYKWTYDHTISLFKPLAYMMIKGIKVDREALKQSHADISAKIEVEEKELKRVADYEFNPGSPKQCIQYFYTHKGIKPYKSVKTGSPTTDDKAMARIFRRYKFPEAKLVQEIRTLRKLLTSYLEVEYDNDGYIRCSYNPRGTWTGRLSSSKTIYQTGMNMQNLDSSFKDFLVVDDV